MRRREATGKLPDNFINDEADDGSWDAMPGNLESFEDAPRDDTGAVNGDSDGAPWDDADAETETSNDTVWDVTAAGGSFADDASWDEIAAERESAHGCATDADSQDEFSGDAYNAASDREADTQIMSDESVRSDKAAQAGTAQDEFARSDKAPQAESARSRKRREKTEKLLQDPPSREQLEQELLRVRIGRKRGNVLKGILMTIITVTAAAALVSTLLLPILRIYGTSMAPTLEEKDMVVAVKTNHVHQGELVAFYFNIKVLVKRLIAGSGDWVDINEAGDVIVNGRALSEPYLTSKSKGQTTDITYPYQVPDGKYFLMGDHRETSIDSRNSQIGCIGQDRMVGRILLRVWPLSHFGLVR